MPCLVFFAYEERKVASTGVFRVPREIRDEDKWFRYFTKKQAAILIASLFLDYRIVTAAAAKGLTLPAIIVSIIFTLIIAGMVMVRLPVDVMFLTGGGITLDEWFLRVFLRLHGRAIYTKLRNEEADG